jgi:two-component system, LytTR family, sensor kinase
LSHAATRAPAPTRGYWPCQAGGWTLYAVTGLVMTRLFGKLDAGQAGLVLAGCALGALTTHLLRGLILRRAWLALPPTRLALRLVASAVGAAAAVVAAVGALAVATRVHPLQLMGNPRLLLASVLNWSFVLLLWLALWAGLHYLRGFRRAEIRRLELDVAARQAQLDALSAQLHPHFLFNALNSLRALIVEDPERARGLVTELATLMRYSLQSSRRERVPLAEELGVVESYLRIETVRWEDRLRWRVEVPTELAGCPIPPMLVQTLAENAVKHGIQRVAAGGTVTVSARRDGDRLHVVVESPGALGAPDPSGTGLANARARLRLLYGDRAALALLEAGGGVRAEVTLPLEAGATP